MQQHQELEITHEGLSSEEGKSLAMGSFRLMLYLWEWEYIADKHVGLLMMLTICCARNNTHTMTKVRSQRVWVALRCEDIFSESSNKECAAIAAAWGYRGIVRESEEAYSRPRAWHSVVKQWAEIVSCKYMYWKRCKICGQSDELSVKQSVWNIVKKGL